MSVNLIPTKPSEKPSESRGSESKEQQIKAAMKALESRKSTVAATTEPKVEGSKDEDDKVTVQLDRKMLAAARQMMLNRKKKSSEPRRSDTRA